jgi:arginase
VDVSLIAVPYHLGRTAAGAAVGPGRIAGAVVARGLNLRTTNVEPSLSFTHEVAATMDVDGELAGAVRRELAAGRLPITLAADCISCLGTLAGMAGPGDRIGVVWLDAHGDFNTAAFSPTGYLDGMALAAAVGLEWRTVAATIPGFEPVEASNVVHLSGRDFDPGELERLTGAGVQVIGPADLGSASSDFGFLTVLAGRVESVYLHVDLDVLDPSEGTSNAYAAPGGISATELTAVVEACMARLPVRTVAFTAYDPDFDPEGRIAGIAAQVIEAILRAQRAA